MEVAMIWKKTDADNPPTQTPLQPPAHPTVPRSQPPPGRDRALIGPSIEIKGSLSGDEDLLIEGRVEGKVELAQHTVTIGTGGNIKADVRGRNIIVMGEVEGDLFGSEQIVLRQASTVRGNLVAPRVSLEDGADFKGSIDMTSKPAAESKPLPKDTPAMKPPSQPALKPDRTEDKA
jgi:cytoskeletal protein CcmA (bactofilin family)